MTVDEDELRRLLGGARDGVTPFVALPGDPGSRPPLSRITARAAELRTRRRAAHALGAASCLALVAAAGLLTRTGTGVPDPTTTAPARSSTAPSPTGSKRPLLLFALTPQFACSFPPGTGRTARIDTATTVAGLPASLLVLPDARLARAPDGVVAGTARCPSASNASGTPRAFVESTGRTSGGAGYMLAALALGDPPPPAGTGVQPVRVRGTTGWWLPAGRDLVWRAGSTWFVLRVTSTRQDALRLATSMRPVRADDARWRSYLPPHRVPSAASLSAGR